MLTDHPAAGGIFHASSVYAENLEALLESLRPRCERFVLFIAADTSSADELVLHEWAMRVLERGATYACCWGPGSGRLETAFDFAAIERETDERAESVIMTTAHEGEPLLDAAWFAVHAAYPSGHFAESTAAVVLATVGNPEWHRELAQFLDDGAPIQHTV
jgi:hypothetical protein